MCHVIKAVAAGRASGTRLQGAQRWGRYGLNYLNNAYIYIYHHGPSSTVFQVVRILDSLTFNNVDLTNDVQPRMSQMFNVSNTVGIRQFQRMAFDSQDYSSGYTHSKINVGLILWLVALI
jgi:hypothetical protein